MSAGPEANPDLVAVACVAEASLILAAEWSRILIEYVHPLLKRLGEVHSSHQFRLAIVTYGAADTRPTPLLSRRFFAPLAQVIKELREEPSKLGIGQINSANSRGLSALEGFVAAIELFDILMASTTSPSQVQSPQKESRSLIFHLLHIAATPPDSSQRPQCNTLQHLDSVSWDSIPNELKKRKINLSLIELRKLPQFQDLQSSVAGTGVQSPWFSVHAPHTLLLCGFPAPQKTGAKRQTDIPPCEQSPEAKRMKVESVSKTSSGSTPAARTQPNQRAQPSSTQPAALGQNPSPAPFHPNHSTSSVSATAAQTASSSATQVQPAAPSLPGVTPELLDQVVVPTGLKFGQMMERLKGLEKLIVGVEIQISTAQSTGQAALVPGLQQDRAQRIHLRDQIKTILKQHYQKMTMAKEVQNPQSGASGSKSQSGSIMAGPSTQALTANMTNGTSSTAETNKPQIPDSQVLANFWQSRGGTVNAANANNVQAGSQTQHPPITPDVAAQMQKLIDKKGIRPQNFGPSAQLSTMGPQETSINTTNASLIQPTVVWQGTLSWTFPQANGQSSEMQLQVIGFVPPNVPGDINMDGWPKIISLIPCKQFPKENGEIQAWLKQHQFRSRLLQFRPAPRVGDAAMNEQKFRTLNQLMSDRRFCSYAGWQQPSGKFMYTFFVFTLGTGFVGAFFVDGLPDLPGIGNTLEPTPSVEEAKSLSIAGINIPPGVMARLQDLDLAQQKQLLARLAREQLLRRQQQQQQQQSQQNQQPQTTAHQDLGTLGVPLAPDQYGTVASNVPAGFYASALNTMSNAAYNPGPSGSGGTVNYEMLQSFMQRTVDGSIPQGMNPN